jgi:RNA 3'-terminal phosphate cyclase (ATP)
MTKMITLDGSFGEGGGQILRTALSLAAIQGRAVRIERIRAGRRKPGLAAQHLTAVRALAEICDAEVSGAEIGSESLVFRPHRPPQAGSYHFDVAAARHGRSAGSATLLLQALLLPLALADGPSTLRLQGGTHVAWSPPWPYLQEVYLSRMAELGLETDCRLIAWGWYPVGGGQIECRVPGGWKPQPLQLTSRGSLLQLEGLAASSRLPRHIVQREAEQMRMILADAGREIAVTALPDVPSPGPGNGVFITAYYQGGVAGFSSLGRRGRRAEEVASAACHQFLQFHRREAVVDRHLADQLVLPLALASAASTFTAETMTDHVSTNLWVVRQFLPLKEQTEMLEDGTARVTLAPAEGTVHHV